MNSIPMNFDYKMKSQLWEIAPKNDGKINRRRSGGVVFSLYQLRRDRLESFLISAAAGFLLYFSAAHGATGAGAHL